MNNSNPLLNHADDVIKFDIDSDLDVESYRKRRAEQTKLRSTIFTADTANCSICGKRYIKEMMVAAHIKKRSECSNEEKRDLSNIAVPMCKLGCDELYERGYIGISDTGKVTVLKEKPVTNAMLEHLASIEK